MEAYDTADELLQLVAKEAKLKYPTCGNYAYEAGCLAAVIRTLAGQHPELLPILQKEVEWHKKQVMCLEGLSPTAS